MEEATKAALVEEMRKVHHAVNSGTVDKETINGALGVMHGLLYPAEGKRGAEESVAADVEPDVDTTSEEDVGGEYDQEGDDHTTHGRRHRRKR